MDGLPGLSLWSLAPRKSPQELILDAIPPIDKHGRMVQKAAVRTPSAALARAGTSVRKKLFLFDPRVAVNVASTLADAAAGAAVRIRLNGPRSNHAVVINV